jgi:hypothetical protein
MPLLHIYDSTDWRIRQTMGARGGTRDTCPVSGDPSALMNALDGLVRARRSYDRILFETHGLPGIICFGDSGYNTNWWRHMRTRGYGSIARVNSRIYFNGCNVAADPDGWNFLAAVADVFLNPGGGEVFGQTSVGFGNPISGHVVHLWGSTRTLYVRSDGRILERFEQ